MGRGGGECECVGRGGGECVSVGGRGVIGSVLGRFVHTAHTGCNNQCS